jgi:hypothetical protein
MKLSLSGTIIKIISYRFLFEDKRYQKLLQFWK